MEDSIEQVGTEYINRGIHNEPKDSLHEHTMHGDDALVSRLWPFKRDRQRYLLQVLIERCEIVYGLTLDQELMI